MAFVISVDFLPQACADDIDPVMDFLWRMYLCPGQKSYGEVLSPTDDSEHAAGPRLIDSGIRCAFAVKALGKHKTLDGDPGSYRLRKERGHALIESKALVAHPKLDHTRWYVFPGIDFMEIMHVHPSTWRFDESLVMYLFDRDGNKVSIPVSREQIYEMCPVASTPAYADEAPHEKYLYTCVNMCPDIGQSCRENWSQEIMYKAVISELKAGNEDLEDLLSGANVTSTLTYEEPRDPKQKNVSVHGLYRNIRKLLTPMLEDWQWEEQLAKLALFRPDQHSRYEHVCTKYGKAPSHFESELKKAYGHLSDMGEAGKSIAWVNPLWLYSYTTNRHQRDISRSNWARSATVYSGLRLTNVFLTRKFFADIKKIFLEEADQRKEVAQFKQEECARCVFGPNESYWECSKYKTNKGCEGARTGAKDLLQEFWEKSPTLKNLPSSKKIGKSFGLIRLMDALKSCPPRPDMVTYGMDPGVEDVSIVNELFRVRKRLRAGSRVEAHHLQDLYREFFLQICRHLYLKEHFSETFRFRRAKFRLCGPWHRPYNDHGVWGLYHAVYKPDAEFTQWVDARDKNPNCELLARLPSNPSWRATTTHMRDFTWEELWELVRKYAPQVLEDKILWSDEAIWSEYIQQAANPLVMIAFMWASEAERCYRTASSGSKIRSGMLDYRILPTRRRIEGLLDVSSRKTDFSVALDDWSKMRVMSLTNVWGGNTYRDSWFWR